MTHETKNISLKTADVDIKIIPVVQWLNTFAGILTLNSCEGAGRGHDKQPYIHFACLKDNSLKHVVLKLKDFRYDLEIKQHNQFWNVSTYCIRFESPEELLRFTEAL